MKVNDIGTQQTAYITLSNATLQQSWRRGFGARTHSKGVPQPKQVLNNVTSCLENDVGRCPNIAQIAITGPKITWYRIPTKATEVAAPVATPTALRIMWSQALTMDGDRGAPVTHKNKGPGDGPRKT